jgi:tetratricopeptide (TPR) repeat protein
MAQTTDLYAVLGVDRSADEREIKKAYFRLVRQYNPESHPEEFRRLREAYEVLSSPTARKEYDEYHQYGEEIGQHLRSGMEAMERGDLRFAQAEFKFVLMLQPELHVARDMLGMAYLNNGQGREALAQFDAIVSTGGAGAAHYLHKGYAHYALDQHAEAIAAHRQAQALDPADTRILVALSDCYTAMDRFEEALGELDQALEKNKGEGGLQDFVFRMRKVQIQLLRDRVDLAEQEIEQIQKVLPDDPEVRRYVSQKLSSLAAQLFRIKRSADGNRMLARAQEMGIGIGAGQNQRPARPPALIFPAWVSRRLVDLPPASQEQVVTMAQRPSPHRLTHGVWGAPVALLLLACGVLFGGVHQALVARTEWQGNTYAFMALLLICGPLLLLYAGTRLHRVLRSKVGRFTTIHPMYLLQVDIDRVTAWPLVNLHDVSMTHHLQNGVYQYTAVKTEFAGANLTLTIRGQQAAVEWAQALLDARHRCLGLLSVGMLEEEEGYDLLPPELLKGQQQAPIDGRTRAQLTRRYGAAAAVGVALLAGGTAYNRCAAERATWQDAQFGARANGMRRYLARYPQGPHAAEAKARLSQIYEDAKARYLQQVPSAPGRQALADVLDALKDAPSAEVLVRYTARVELDDLPSEPLQDGTTPIPPERAFSAAQNRLREASITRNLADAFGRLLPTDVISLGHEGVYGSPSRTWRRRAGQPAQAAAPSVIFDVTYTISPSGQMYRSTSDRSALHGVQIAWVLQIRTPAAAARGEAPYTVELTSQPMPSIRYMRSGYDDSIVPYTKMAESAFGEFGRKVAEVFGATLPRPVTWERPPLTPGTRRALTDIRRRGLPPEALREMERYLQMSK